MRVLQLSIGIVLLAMLSGCGLWRTRDDGGSFGRKPTKLAIDLVARAALNPGESDRPYSVVVRIYQLRDRVAFGAASYEDLLASDRTVLAADLQDAQDVVVLPDGRASLTQRLQPATRFIGVVAFFHDGEVVSDWRRVVPREELPRKLPLVFELVDHALVARADPTGKRR